MRFIMILAPLVALIASIVATHAFGVAHLYVGAGVGLGLCFISGVLLGRNLVAVNQ